MDQDNDASNNANENNNTNAAAADDASSVSSVSSSDSGSQQPAPNNDNNDDTANNASNANDNANEDSANNNNPNEDTANADDNIANNDNDNNNDTANNDNENNDATNNDDGNTDSNNNDNNNNTNETNTSDEATVKAHLDKINRPTWQVLPPVTASEGAVLQEMNSARLAQLVAIAQADRENIQRVHADIDSSKAAIEKVRALLAGEVNSSVVEAQNIHAQVDAKMPQLRDEVFAMQNRINDDRFHVERMKQRLVHAEKEQSLLNSEVDKWRKLTQTWESNREEQQRSMSRIRDETAERRTVVNDARSRLDDDRRETKKIAEEMGDLTVSVGVGEDDVGVVDLDLDNLTIEAMDGTIY